MFDKLMILAIAISQFLLSVALTEIALYGSPSFLLIFGLWGLINTVALFSSSVLPRISSLIWHLIFVGYVLVASISKPLDNPSNKTVLLWAVVDLAAIFYLAQVTRRYVRQQPSQKRNEADQQGVPFFLKVFSRVRGRWAPHSQP